MQVWHVSYEGGKANDALVAERGRSPSATHPELVRTTTVSFRCCGSEMLAQECAVTSCGRTYTKGSKAQTEV